MVKSVADDKLLALRAKGVQSDALDARLAFMKARQVLSHYVNPLVRKRRVYPRMTAPQATGRLSVSAPPLINFPPSIRDIVVPDEGWAWVEWDWEAVEARIVAHLCRDEADLAAFRQGHDIHTVTLVHMFGLLPCPVGWKKAQLFGTEEGRAWCAALPVPDPPYHDKHRWRTLVKNTRYTLQYAKRPEALTVYASEFSMPPEELVNFGRRYLASKPALVAWKQRTWAECWERRVVYTAYLGRRRYLYGDRKSIEKEGLNTKVQGSVADLMRETVGLVCGVFPEAHLAYQTHDGVKTALPKDLVTSEVRERIKSIVEREVVMEGRPIRFPATWGE
mgnify:CR=1 FL=1